MSSRSLIIATQLSSPAVLVVSELLLALATPAFLPLPQLLLQLLELFATETALTAARSLSCESEFVILFVVVVLVVGCLRLRVVLLFLPIGVGIVAAHHHTDDKSTGG